MNEVESGLQTMDVLAAVVEPGFKESDWCAQEVGYALGRKIDIVPLRAGLDPFGFFGKYQGIQIKGKYPKEVAGEIARLLLKKPKHREQLLGAIAKAFSALQSDQKIDSLTTLDSWSVVTDKQLKVLLESSALTKSEQSKLAEFISRTEAFKPELPVVAAPVIDDDIPF